MIASALGALPIGMFGLGILLLAREASGSFATAGRVVAAFGLANALGAVAQGRLMDRLGQTRVLRGAAVIHAAGLAALVLAADEARPRSCSRRARWSPAAPSLSCRPPCARCGACSCRRARPAARPTRSSRSCSRCR